jgi:hypothetical protein
MVMDADGTNRREVYRTAAHFCDCDSNGNLKPSISPDGQWVTFIDGDGEVPARALWKVSVDGGAPQKLLCGHGPNIWTNSFGHQWSPDGTEIVVHLMDWVDAWVVVIPSDGVQSCPFNIGDFEIFTHPMNFDYIGTTTWNQDGSQVALLTVDLVARIDWLTIVDRNTRQVTQYEIEWPPGVVGGNVDLDNLHSLDWQRSNSLVFAFDSGDTVWLLTADPTTLKAVAEELGEGSSPTWSPDGSQLLFGPARISGSGRAPDGMMTLFTVATGESEFLGTGYDPDWRLPAPVTCSVHADCDDENPCTDNSCVGGVCDSYNNNNECVDGNPCTFSDSCAAGVCSGDPILDGTSANCSGWCCDGECWIGADSCVPPPADCWQFDSKKSCNADPACRWDNRNKECLSG